MRARTILLTFLFIASAFIGCDRRAGSPDDVVAVAIAQTLTAEPSATSQPTLTPQATLTPLPTLTVQATLTPMPTLTPPATATVRPTYTPLPTLTPPATATAVAEVGGTSGSGGVVPQAGFSFDHRFLNIVRDYFNEMAAMVFIGNRYDPENPGIVIGLDDQLECPQYLGLYNAYHDRLLNEAPGRFRRSSGSIQFICGSCG